ncbi:hypothetical protein EDB19DRAFT_111707 [Suillus lakei]|nr:hypothetical protein EDB19DRAFT_111707 [Suillus lakei]
MTVYPRASSTSKSLPSCRHRSSPTVHHSAFRNPYPRCADIAQIWSHAASIHESLYSNSVAFIYRTACKVISFRLRHPRVLQNHHITQPHTTPSSTTQSCPPNLQYLLQFPPLSGCFQRPAPVHRTSLHPPHEQLQPPTLQNNQHPHCWRTELVQCPDEPCLCVAAPNSCSCGIHIPFSYVHPPRCASSHCLASNLHISLLLLPPASPSQGLLVKDPRFSLRPAMNN